jgi:hypothetical protein
MKEKQTFKQMINSSCKDECVDNEVVNQENTLSKETSATL